MSVARCSAVAGADSPQATKGPIGRQRSYRPREHRDAVYPSGVRG